mgnify:CR=1 FL=1
MVMSRRQLRYGILILITCLMPVSQVFAQFGFRIDRCNDSSEVIALFDTCLLSNISPDRYKNIQFDGDPKAVGYFSNGYIFGFNTPRGIVMSTGFSDQLDGYNTCSGQNSSGNNNGGSDSDLTELSNSNITDACIIEFDFMPMGDTSELSIVFGSEEYHDYVNLGYLDALGLFLSGPGISGNYSDNAINIAVVPETSLPVSIGNINCGQQQSYCTSPPGGNNCELLYDNTNQSLGSFNQIALDAYTVPMLIDNETQPGSWYHIKIGIGDGGDAAYDSGLFLEAGSFFTGLYTYTEEENDVNENAFVFEIFPNPAKKSFQCLVNSRIMFIFEVLIFNQYGVQEFRKTFNHHGGQNTYKIEIPNLNSGIHFVKVLTSSGMTRLLKLEVVN